MQVQAPFSTRQASTITPTAAKSPAPAETLIPLSPVVTLTPQPSMTPAPEFQLCSPLAETSLRELPEIVSQLFLPPPAHHEEGHHGVDLAYYRRNGRSSILGEGVQSVFAGRVAAAVSDRFPYGNMVIVEAPGSELPGKLVSLIGLAAGESLYVLYAHLNYAPEVTLGDAVEACQLLGEVGKSGNAAVAHLHLEMRIGPVGEKFSGMAYYIAKASDEERLNYVQWRTSGIFRMIDPMAVLSSAPDQ